jgi:hypothetical protein
VHPKFFCAEESSLRTICAITFTLLILSAFSRAQWVPKRGNAFFGYSYSGGQVFNPGAIGVHMNGWEGSAEGKFLPWLGGVADLDWHYGGTSVTCGAVGPNCPSLRFRLNGTRESLLFGPRASADICNYTVFAQFLLGLTFETVAAGTTSTSDKSFSDGVGGGVDYKLLKSVAWRGQVDWIHMRLFGGNQSNVRISTGIVFRF